ncbi:hypothetical protein [Alteribacillus bidgolensis]|uniref:Uncharacterized protein n=1 Tax=Alteribacillus bidgolensis TaxID=930129 RepID=A0A1G8Q7B0_9BACI|nr:hypothetical protein [Alteribacillus bidgolensis]SDJ00305.1 hypothetical protein SAMN05216352_11817 [Alteribacillus bidgolensis]
MFNKDRVNLRKRVSKWYIIGTSSVFLVMAYFLSSGLFMEEEFDVLASPIKEEIDTRGQSEMEILEWIYDKGQNKMQVLLDIKDLRFDAEELQYRAIQRSDARELQVTIPYQLEEYVVVNIDGIDQEFVQMSLEVLEENEEGEYQQIAQLFTDMREVDREQIDTIDQENYLFYVMDTLIETSEEDIKMLENQREESKNEVAEMDDEIRQIKNERMYETEEEQLQTDNYINSLEAEKEQVISEEEEIKEKIKIEKERIKNYKERKRDSTISPS